MSDWAPGDLALCVDDGPLPDGRECPFHAGSVSEVVLVSERGAILHLLLSGNASLFLYASRFRKIRPDEHQACEPEFVTLLKRSKRKVSA